MWTVQHYLLPTYSLRNLLLDTDIRSSPNKMLMQI